MGKLGEDHETNASYLRMFFLGIVVVSPSFLSGLNFSYTTIALPQMNLSLDDASWFGSINGISSFISTILSGFIIQKFGRKSALVFALLPSTAGWLFLLWNHNTFTILVGQMLNGFTIGSVGHTSQVYAGECIMANHVRLRSSYIMWSSLADASASLFMFSLATFLQYRQICVIVATVAVILLLLVCFCIPESPTWLYLQGRIEDAERSQRKLGIRQPILVAQSSPQIALDEESRPLLQRCHESGRWCQLDGIVAKIRRPEVWRPLASFSVFSILLSFSGVYAVLTYMVEIFDGNVYGDEQTLAVGSARAGPKLKPTPASAHSALVAANNSSGGGGGDGAGSMAASNATNSYVYCMVAGVFMFTAATFASFALPYVGLRKMLICSSLAIAVVMAAIMFTAVAEDGLLYGIRIVAVWLMTFLFSLTAMTPYSAAGDALPTDAKGFASLCHLCGLVSSAMTRKIFPFLCVAIGAYTYCIFGVVSILCALHVYFFMTEIVGKTLNEINREFRNAELAS